MGTPVLNLSSDDVEQAPSSSASPVLSLSSDDVEQASQPTGPVNPYAKPQADMSRANQPFSAEDEARYTRSAPSQRPGLWQQFKNDIGAGQAAVDTAATPPPIDTSSVGGFVRSVGGALGAGATRLVFEPFAHPLDTANGAARLAEAGMGNPAAQREVSTRIASQFLQNPSGEAVAALPAAALATTGLGEGAAPEAAATAPENGR